MGETKISWADFTFNPWWGCQKVSPGCDHCYAESLDRRTGGDHWGPHAERRTMSAKYWLAPLKWNDAAKAAGRPAFVFCASMADVMDNKAPEGERERLFKLIDRTPWLVWLLLTKRPENFERFLPAEWDIAPRPNVWLGVTAEDQERANYRVSILLKTSAVRRFVSYEPALGPVDFTRIPLTSYGKTVEVNALRRVSVFAPSLDWIIAGCESAPGKRPGRAAEDEWFLSVMEQCDAAGVAFWLKQIASRGKIEERPNFYGGQWLQRPEPALPL